MDPVGWQDLKNGASACLTGWWTFDKLEPMRTAVPTASDDSFAYQENLARPRARAPLWSNIVVAATGQSSVTGYVFTARTPEAFLYDSDGNLTNDGRWSYTWDAENRLVIMTANTLGGGPQQRLKFEYDSKGRRIRKQVWPNTTGSGNPTNDVKFVYDGWSLVGELSSASSVILNTRATRKTAET